MATKKKTENKEVKEINVSLNLKTITLLVRGVSPLIMHNFDWKSIQEIEERAPGKAKQGKTIVTPEEAYHRSLYLLSDGVTTYFPADGFKKGMVRAAQVGYNEPMVKTQTLFRVIGDGETENQIIIRGEHRMRTDMVRIGGVQKVAAPRYRAEFPEWSANVTIQYIADAITEEQIISYLNMAGFSCGIGEWRPGKSGGGYGMYQVASN